MAASLAAVAPVVAQAGCKYTRLGSIPLQWVGSRMTIQGSINDTPLAMVVDTGAANNTVSGTLARRINLPLQHVAMSEVGLGGRSEASGAHVNEITFGKFQWRNTRVLVTWDANGIPDVLVSAAFLFQRDVELTDKEIIFFSPAGCDDASLAYWADDVPWVATEAVTADDRRANVTVLVNGRPVRALVDSGAPLTMLDSAVARQLGFDPDAAATRVGQASGIGKHVTPMSTATFDTIAIGPEVIHKPRIIVADLWQGVQADIHRISTEGFVDAQPKMILGADFVKSHHILFATSQRRMYFSYVGGEVFRAPRAQDAPTTAAPAAAASTPAMAEVEAGS